MPERAEHQEAERSNRPAQAPESAPAAGSAGELGMLGLQQAFGNQAVVQYLQQRGALSTPGDPQEREADRAAQTVLDPQATGPATISQAAASSDTEVSGALDAGIQALGPGQPLDPAVRAVMEPRFGTDFGSVRVHTDGAASRASAALGAEAFTYGEDIYFGPGRQAGRDGLTAHELSHVVQQRRAGGGQLAAKRIQPSFSASYPVTLGVFEVDLQTREGALAGAGGQSGMDGYIRFVPNPDAPNSNKIIFIQIARATTVAGADVNAVTQPPGQAPRGALGDPGVRTQADPARGIEGGFASDVYHGLPGQPPAAQGSPMSPAYPVGPAPAGVATGMGQTQQPAQYGGGTGGSVGQTPGFKRSSEAADIRSAAMYDFPGLASTATDLNFDFESVARGEDSMVVYGSVHWGFQLRAGHVVNEYLNPVDAQSATFDEALERHRDFYVHEPVTFYFEFNSATLGGEADKIDTFLEYLRRNPTVRMSLEGFADERGGPSNHNLDLSLKRAEAVHAALVAKGIDPGRIDDIDIGSGASTAATTDAGTGDQGGNPAVGADQDREANRWANRRVVLTFEQTASTRAGAAVAP
jgi:outer membrane protein OmpA-like peptidoglycan-associated protein